MAKSIAQIRRDLDALGSTLDRALAPKGKYDFCFLIWNDKEISFSETCDEDALAAVIDRLSPILRGKKHASDKQVQEGAAGANTGQEGGAAKKSN